MRFLLPSVLLKNILRQLDKLFRNLLKFRLNLSELGFSKYCATLTNSDAEADRCCQLSSEPNFKFMFLRPASLLSDVASVVVIKQNL